MVCGGNGIVFQAGTIFVRVFVGFVLKYDKKNIP
jgi:hypothetical protein